MVNQVLLNGNLCRYDCDKIGYFNLSVNINYYQKQTEETKY